MAGEYDGDRLLPVCLGPADLVDGLIQRRHAMSLKAPFSNTPRSTLPFSFRMMIRASSLSLWYSGTSFFGRMVTPGLTSFGSARRNASVLYATFAAISASL